MFSIVVASGCSSGIVWPRFRPVLRFCSSRLVCADAAGLEGLGLASIVPQRRTCCCL